MGCRQGKSPAEHPMEGSIMKRLGFILAMAFLLITTGCA